MCCWSWRRLCADWSTTAAIFIQMISCGIRINQMMVMMSVWMICRRHYLWLKYWWRFPYYTYMTQKIRRRICRRRWTDLTHSRWWWRLPRANWTRIESPSFGTFTSIDIDWRTGRTVRLRDWWGLCCACRGSRGCMTAMRCMCCVGIVRSLRINTLRVSHLCVWMRCFWGWSRRVRPFKWSSLINRYSWRCRCVGY